MDGGNSLKRMLISGQRTAADTRMLDDCDYVLPREYVNRFANEVRGRESKGPTVPREDDTFEDDFQEDANGPLVEGDPTDTIRDDDGSTNPDDDRRKKLALCVRNWKSAAQESNKKMWAMFEESGVFASACRHGSILWIADMVCSGEL